MTLEQAIKQLNDLKDDRMAFANVDDPGDPFVRDIIAIDTVLSYVRKMPKRGKWIGDKTNGGFFCSRCGIWKRHVRIAHFCPNCGADMREDGKQHD